MIDKELQLIVDGYVPGERFTVVGRCGDMAIHVGDAFDAVYRYRQRRYPDELGDDPIREEEKPADIRVISIHAYERCLQTMGEGMTGSLTLEGDGLQYLAPGWILGRKTESSSPIDQVTEHAVTSV
jgi:hypothetical protein